MTQHITSATGLNGLGGTSSDDIINDLLGDARGIYLVAYSANNNTLSGDAGNDYLDASDSTSNNTLSGCAGDDTLFAAYSYGNNTLSGGAGDDLGAIRLGLFQLFKEI